MTTYLDWNATTPLWPEAKQAILEALDDGFGNPSSGHAIGRRARAIVEAARASVAELVGAEPSEVVFVSGATEALAMAVHSAGPGRVVASALEHPALVGAVRLGPGRVLQTVASGAPAVAVTDVIAAVERGTAPALLAVMAAQNVTGALQPIGELAIFARARKLPFLVDAAQLAGRLPAPWLGDAAARPDYVVLAAHKLGGPKGIGALVVRAGAPLMPLFTGGGQERGRRAGTEAVPFLAGFGAAARATLARREAEVVRLTALRDALEAALVAALPGAWVVSAGAPRLPQTTCLVLPEGVEGEAVVGRLSRADIAVSAGSACHSGSPEPSPILMASGLTAGEALRVVRIGLGFATTAEDTARLVAALPRIVAEVAR